MLPAAVRRFDLIPARVPGHGGQLHLDWALPWPRARLRVTLYDLDGREVIRLLPETGAAGRGGRDVTLAGAPAGFYWAVLEARPETGPERIAETRPLRITGTAP
jgi:hypothetical protein